MAPSEVFETELPLIRNVTRHICRKQSFSFDDCEEFTSYVYLKMVENDYRILRRFEGRCSLRTFLTVTVGRLALDFQNHKWGKWRPSAMAQRMGETAVQVETLLSRDGRDFEEVVTRLKDTAAGLSRKELESIAAQLPLRLRRFESPDGLGSLENPAPHPDQVLEDEERRRHLRAVWLVLESKLNSMEAEDRLIIKLRFLKNMKVVQIADVLHVEPRPLYARIHRLLASLRQALEADGFAGEQLQFWLNQ